MKLTVALPVYNGKEIAWLCLASLKRQIPGDFEWDLIVYEEEHEQQLGEEYFWGAGIGCNVTYMTGPTRYTLGEKWHKIIQQSDSDGIVFCAADNYYHPYMLLDSVAALSSGVDWFFTTKGYFYDFVSKKIILYNSHLKTGLQMAASMDIAKTVPNKPRKRIVDLWLRNNMHPQNPQIDTSDHWMGTLFTNGYNTISHKRGQYFDNVKNPFRKTDTRLEEIVPEEIVQRIKSME